MSGVSCLISFVHLRQDTPEYKVALANALSGEGPFPDNSTNTILHVLYAAAGKVSKSDDLVQALNQVSTSLQAHQSESDELVRCDTPQTGPMIVAAIKEAAEDFALAIKKVSVRASVGGSGSK